MKKIIKIILAVLLAFFLFGLVAGDVQSIKPLQTQVANDFEEQYTQVKLHGTMMDRCVRAGLVAEGYLQAGDNTNFAKWVDIKKADCKAAGLPQ
jgi:hypothetical protein